MELNNKPEVKLDWEHTEFKWVPSHEVESCDTAAKLNESLKRVL